MACIYLGQLHPLCAQKSTDQLSRARNEISARVLLCLFAYIFRMLFSLDRAAVKQANVIIIWAFK